MSKFIRTENMIYELTDNLIIKDNQLYEKEYGSDYFSLELIYLRDVFLGKVINQADTIEELCDTFVVDWFHTNHKDIFSIDKYSKKVIESCIGNSKTNVYGAVWTDKGLIYVAKMNDRGDLELI